MSRLTKIRGFDMAEIRIWQKAFIESHMASEKPEQKAQAVCLAFKYEYTLTEIAVHTGWDEGRIVNTILSQCDPREGG